MGVLDGRVVIVTGADARLGRAHAPLIAAEGAHVIVNDLGSAIDGTGADPKVAEAVVAEIESAGGSACAGGADAATTDDAQELLDLAVSRFGRLPGVADLVRKPEDPEAFDVYDAANVSPTIAWLLSAQADVTGKVCYVKGGEIRLFDGWSYAAAGRQLLPEGAR